MLETPTIANISKFSRKRWSEQVEFKSYEEARSEFQKQYFTDLLRFSRGNVVMAARFARRDRSHVHKILRKYGIDPSQFRREFKTSWRS